MLSILKLSFFSFKRRIFECSKLNALIPLLFATHSLYSSCGHANEKNLGSDSRSKIFRFHLFSEPTTLNPQKSESSTGSYIIQNLYRGLLSWDDQKGLVPELAQKCLWKHKGKRPEFRCIIKDDLKWSDGSKIQAADFKRSFFNLLSQSINNPKAQDFQALVEFREIQNGQIKNWQNWSGIEVIKNDILDFKLESSDTEFDLRLSSVQASLYDETRFSGPYKLKLWRKGESIELSPNENYLQGHKTRPDIKAFFISDDQLALRLFEKGELDFLRRLPTQYIPQYRSSPSYFEVPVARLDYWAFGSVLREDLIARRILSTHLNFKDLQEIFHSVGTPGCIGLPTQWIGSLDCVKFSPETNKKEDLIKFKSANYKIQFLYSNQGGDDHRRAAEWIQSQWLKNLGLQISIRSLDNKVFMQEIKINEPLFFRKGLAPDRPSCLSALESFISLDSTQFQIKDKSIQDKIVQLGKTWDKNKKKELCQSALKEIILEKHYLLPTGPFHFSMLINSKFKGLKFNTLNQLDLSNLSVAD